MHFLPTDDRVFGTVGLCVVCGACGWVTARVKGLKVVVVGLSLEVCFMVGGNFSRGG